MNEQQEKVLRALVPAGLSLAAALDIVDGLAAAAQSAGAVVERTLDPVRKLGMRVKPPAKARERKPRAPRSAASGNDLTLLDRVLEHLPSEGAKSTELQAMLEVGRAPLAKALAIGLEMNKLRAEGEKRARTYFRA